MNTLKIRNIGFGLLMGLVLAFSVQGTADALTFGTTRTGDLETLFPGEAFSISFSVNLESEVDIKNAAKKQVSEDNNTRIDSSGYKAKDIGSSTYRLLPTSGVTYPSDLYYKKDNAYTSASTSNFVVDTSEYVHEEVEADDKAYPVYVRTGTDPNFKYTQLKRKPDRALSDSLQHHYNDEAIAIHSPVPLKRNSTTIRTFAPASDTSSTTFNGTRSSRLNGVALTSENNAFSMVEDNDDRDQDSDYRLSSSITLKGKAPGAPGWYTIEIIDVTHTADFPTADRPVEQARQAFRIYVVPTGSLQASTLLFSRDRTSDYEIANDNSDPRIDNLFGSGSEVFNVSQKNLTPLTYKVKGSGRLFVEENYNTVDGFGTPEDSEGSKGSTLTVSAHAKVWLDMNGSSNKVTAYVRDRDANTTSQSILFVFNHATIEIDHGEDQTGAPGALLGSSFGVKVKDSKGSALSGLAVRFTPSSAEKLKAVPDTTVYLNESNAWGGVTNYTDTTRTSTARASSPAETNPNAPAWVQTDSSGIAKVYLRIGSGTAGDVTLTATTSTVEGQVPPTKTLYATRRLSVGIPSIEIVSGDNQKSDKNGNLSESLVVLVKDGYSNPYPNRRVTFTTTKGNLITDPDYQVNTGENQTTNGPALTVTANTDGNGKASVTYQLGNYSGASSIVAQISSKTVPTYQRQVTFNINGTGSTTTPPATTQPTQPTQPTTPTTVTVSPTSISGAPGSTQTLTITGPTTAQLTIGSLDFSIAGGAVSPSSGTGSLTSTLTLPSTTGTYTLTVNDAGTTVQTVSVNVTTTTTTTQTTGTLSISVPFSGAPGSTQTATITATGSDGNLASGVVVTLAVTNGGGTFSPASVTTGTEGTAVSVLTRGSTVGTNYFVTANATGYTEGRTRISIATGSTPPTTTTPTTPTTPPTVSGSASSIKINGQATRSGTLNEALAAPLVVEVLDRNSRSVAEARVIFRVRSGQGWLSQRGSRRAVAVETDSRGYARATYTPRSANSTVEASVGGVSETVTFTITTGAAPATSTPGTGTSTPTPIEPKILVGAANRPAMYWIDSGMLYGLTGAKATKIAEAVNGVAVGDGKVYWTSATGASSGTIHSANLDGSGVKALKSILAVPMGIAVDTADRKLYWTNSRGRIQSANLDGSGIRNVRQNLSDPTDIALSDTHIYWVASGDTIRRVNMTGTRVVNDVAVGLMNVGGIAVGGGKVYWTEKTGASAGTINAANLDGTQFKTLATILAAPMGIAVDTAGSKLYWTNARGRVQRANLNGSKIQNVVDGLGSPSHIAIGGANQATATKPATQPTVQEPKKDTAKYDVNGDGTVDNVDASLVSGAMGTNTAKYDVNGDGTVNFLDLLLVFDNRDDDAAGAPTVLGMQLRAVQIAVIEEQIDLLIATGDRSPAAMRTLIYLQQLLATARPEKTQLLANYPNPFNPETWIPYELAADTDVRITIYNAQGVVIRTLQLGQQSAGYYTDRERAAYWDGRNALGEQVASGIYFYQFETDAMSSMRKMVILK